MSLNTRKKKIVLFMSYITTTEENVYITLEHELSNLQPSL